MFNCYSIELKYRWAFVKYLQSLQFEHKAHKVKDQYSKIA